MGETFLTKKQQKILTLLAKGLSKREIAEILGTTVPNVCILERRAKANIAKAAETVALAKKLTAPVRVKVTRGEDIMKIPGRLLKKADEVGVKVKASIPGIISEIREKAGEKIQGRRAKESFEVAITGDGGIIVT
ncbi:MAG: Tfx family DNA-binding protein [Candidatus Hadarchaeales archaeon]